MNQQLLNFINKVVSVVTLLVMTSCSFVYMNASSSSSLDESTALAITKKTLTVSAANETVSLDLFNMVGAASIFLILALILVIATIAIQQLPAVSKFQIPNVSNDIVIAGTSCGAVLALFMAMILTKGGMFFAFGMYVSVLGALAMAATALIPLKETLIQKAKDMSSKQ